MNGKEDIKRRILLETVPSLFYRPEIDNNSIEKLEYIKDFLKENSKYSFIAYFNHISYNDPAIAAYIAEKIDPQHNRHLIAPASFSHTDPDDSKSKGFTFLIDLAKQSKIEIVRVIQSYQVNNPKYGYTEAEANKTYRDLMRRLKELQKSETPTGMIISPEGHRSESGKMILAESGILGAGRMLAPILYVPVGINYFGKYDRDTINIGRKVKISIGEPTAQIDPKNSPSLDELMYKLAETLPESMRGIWE